MHDEAISQLVRDLATPSARDAWEEFLRRFAPIIFDVVKHFEKEEDRVADCFIYICQELSKDRCHKLRKFDLNGPARFSTWLYAVVRNLCLDWHRKEAGRHRVFRTIKKLSPFDQVVFKRIYEQDNTQDETLAALTPHYASLTLDDIIEAR